MGDARSSIAAGTIAAYVGMAAAAAFGAASMGVPGAGLVAGVLGSYLWDEYANPAFNDMLDRLSDILRPSLLST